MKFVVDTTLFMSQVYIGALLSFIITLYCIPIIIHIAEAKKLFDHPDDDRKLHTKPIPSLGGVALFISISISLGLINEAWISQPEFSYYFTTMVIIFFLGLKDDILVISPWKKLLGQILVALILTHESGLLIDNMQGFLGLYSIPQSFAYFLSIFTIVVIINAFNLIDGVDGLAGSVGAIISTSFGFYFLVNQQYSYAALAFSLSAGLLAFLVFNFHPAKIFMGDGGSMLVGLIVCILAIKFIQIAPSGITTPIPSSPVLGFGFLLLPLMDTLRVFSLRMIKGRSPFSPDRNHIHHLLLDRGLRHRTVAILSALFSLLFITVSYFLSIYLSCTLAIFSLIAVFYLYVGILYLTRKRRSKDFLKVIRNEERA
jgi:UDP-N-acetylmuramyl pentapeptide phosphotransferase/UDP-N-acetylglucosamine-1-phosphate transferase